MRKERKGLEKTIFVPFAIYCPQFYTGLKNFQEEQPVPLVGNRNY